MKQLRFCVGDPDGRRSTVWKVWTSKDDAYIQTRMMGSSTKVSLHSDGRCQWSFTSEWFGVNRPGEKNVKRHIVRWQRPEIQEGIAALVFRIFIPQSELRDVKLNESLKNVQWIPAPASDMAKIVECYITPPVNGSVSDLPFQHLASLQLRGSKLLVLLTHEESMTRETENLLESLREQVYAAAQADLIVRPEFRGVGFIEGHKGERGMVEFVPFKGS